MLTNEFFGGGRWDETYANAEILGGTDPVYKNDSGPYNCGEGYNLYLIT